MNDKKQEVAAEENNEAADNMAKDADIENADVTPTEDDLQQKLTAMTQELQKSQDDCLRAIAESENIQRRSDKKIAEAHQYGLSNFALAVGEVRDCLEIALQSASEQQYEKMHEGVSLTLRKLITAMDVRHILPITPDIGAMFDPTVHMAIGKMPASQQASDGTVAAVIQAGYMLNGRVIRAANVMVAEQPEQPEQKIN